MPGYVSLRDPLLILTESIQVVFAVLELAPKRQYSLSKEGVSLTFDKSKMLTQETHPAV